jgi:hypothetical protein
MANKIQLRRDTTANWERVNPILADGEPGLDITTNQVKYGDGANVWVDLSYSGGISLPYTFPSTDGAAYQIMQTNGSGSLTWVNNEHNYISSGTSGVTIPGENGDVIVSVEGTTFAQFSATGVEFPNGDVTVANNIAGVIDNDLAIKTSIDYQVSKFNFVNSNNSYIIFDGFAVGPTKYNSFTIEFFFKLTDDPATNQHAFLGAGAGGGLSMYTGAGVGNPNNNTITVDCNGSSNQQFTVPTMDGNWHHLILVRKGAESGPGTIGSMTMWYNGVQVGSFNDVTLFTGITNAIGMWNDTNYHLAGSMAGIRITNTAAYDPSVTTYPVPTKVAPLVNGTHLLLRVQDAGDNAYVDSSPYRYALTVGSDTNAGGYVVVPNPDNVRLQVEIDQKWNFGIDGVLTLPNGAHISSTPVKPMISNTSEVLYYAYDAGNLTVNALMGDTVKFSGFSGQILINDHVDGQVELWLCGGGVATRLGTSKDSDSTTQDLGTIIHEGGIGGYIWTCDKDGTYVFVATRTRNEA